VAERGHWSRQRLQTALAPFGHANGPGLFENGRNFLIPLHIERQAGKRDVVASVVNQLEAIAVRLDAAVDPNELLVADEPEEDIGNDETEALDANGTESL
jgi:hypothetical protein